MNPFQIFPLTLLVQTMTAVGSPLNWENPAKFQVEKLPPSASSMPFPDRESAVKQSRLESTWCIVLNGNWKFQWVGRPDALPPDFHLPEANVSNWKEISVPSNWQIHGYGTPLYTSGFAFAADPPRVMSASPTYFTNHPESVRNPTAAYRRDFVVPTAWKGRPVVLSFQGVDSAFDLWVNGEKAGYSEDSRATAEFEITRHLKEGTNTLAVAVYQFSDGSYLEGHDQWRLSGIFRDVFLKSPAVIDVTDHWLHAGLTGDRKKGLIRFEAELTNRGAAAAAKVKLEILKGDGGPLYQTENLFEVAENSRAAVRFPEAPLDGVEFWSAETPTLYRYVITVSSPDGKVLSCRSGKTGFRHNELKNGRFLHNGEPILFKGVNYHDHHPRTGHTVTEKDLRDELLAMKRANINSIRCSSGPNDPRFYELCNELGFYVVNVANIGLGNLGPDPVGVSLANESKWAPACLDRVRNMIERDKNHPCIVMWSVGAESSQGANIRECASWIQSRDPSRPLHDLTINGTDMVGISAPSYLPISTCLDYCRQQEMKPLEKQQPMIFSEYNLARGNSSGNLEDYWVAVRNEPLLQGGFIQSWKDYALHTKKHGSNAVADRSERPHKTHLSGFLSKEEGLYGGGLLIDADEKLDLKGPFTLIAEIQCSIRGDVPISSNRSNAEAYPILTKGDSAYSLNVTPDGKHIDFSIHSEGQRKSVTAPLPESIHSQFHTIAASYDGSRLAIVIDGTEVATAPANGPVSTNTFRVAIGLNAEKPSCRFAGSIRMAEIHPRALKPEDTLNKPAGATLKLNFTEDAEKPATRMVYAYGGDFNDQPNQGSFCITGVMTPNLRPSPQFEEVKKTYQDMHVKGIDLNGPSLVVELRNERFFRKLEDIASSWKLFKNGDEVASGKLTYPPLAPQGVLQLTIPSGHQPDPSAEYVLRLRHDQKQLTAWHPVGMPVAWDEIPLPWGKRSAPKPKPSPSNANFEETADKIIVKTETIEAAIDKSNGVLVSLKRNQKEYLLSPLRLNFWRVPTSNDKAANFDDRLEVWRTAGAKTQAISVTSRKEDNDVVITSELAIPAGQSRATLTWRFTGGGQIAVHTRFAPAGDLPVIPRIGFHTTTSNNLQSWKWFGKGPHENHIDRQSGSWTAIHEGIITSLFHRYIDPQEAGNRTCIRWATLTPPIGGLGLRIDATGDHLLEMSVLPCLVEDLELAHHSIDLPPSKALTLQIDHRQMGVGTSNSIDHLPLQQYRIEPKGTYEWSFLLTTTESPMMQPRRIPSVPRLPPGVNPPNRPKLPTPEVVPPQIRPAPEAKED